jgi:hypothetical protein
MAEHGALLSRTIKQHILANCIAWNAMLSKPKQNCPFLSDERKRRMDVRPLNRFNDKQTRY